MNLARHKLTTDIAWTLGSFSVLAASGIVINIVVAALRDAAALGVFNLAYAVYIVASQIAVFGLHYSVMRHAAYHEGDASTLGRLLFTAGAAALGLGLLAAMVTYLAAPWLGHAFDSPAVGQAIAQAAWGLSLFPLNKVLVAYLNGLRRMKAFAILQAGRYLAVMAWVTVVAASTLPFEMAGLAFLAAETLTTLGAALYIAGRRLAGPLRQDGEWLRRHFAFGGKSLLAGTFVELNSRVDVLLIGLFLSDRAVGIYSFAAMLVDGLYHVLAMIRVNFNPVLVAALRDGRWPEAQDLLRRARRYVYPATLLLALLVAAAFWGLATWVVPGKGLLEGLPALLILLAGLSLISAYIPFDNLLLASGHPGYQTAQHLIVLAANAGLNLALVPVWGITGAAVATAISYLAGITALVLFSRRLLRWNLVNNLVQAA